jgi:hypothetical protein
LSNIKEVFTEVKHLSMSDCNIILYEYTEEWPSYLNEKGMVSRLRNFIFKKNLLIVPLEVLLENNKARISLENISDHNMAFKIKSNNPSR